MERLVLVEISGLLKKNLPSFSRTSSNLNKVTEEFRFEILVDDIIRDATFTRI